MSLWKAVIVVSTLLTLGSTYEPTNQLCGSSAWIYFNGSCYYFSNSTGLDWHRAKQACHMKDDSHLVSILNDKENEFITNEINSRRYDKVFIGLNDISNESEWIWEDNSTFQYKNFRDGQPDNWAGDEDCVHILYNGKWNDIYCKTSQPFICKKNKGYCKPGWKHYGRKCYLFMFGTKELRDFQGATSYCRQWAGGDLVSIHDSYENAFIVSQLAGVTSSVYIGLSARNATELFLWNDQSSVDYKNWHYHQQSRHGDENCVELLPFKYRGRWKAINCNKTNRFVCQLASAATKPTGTPATTKAPSDPCPTNYKKFQSSCYRSFVKPQSWFDAQKTCEKEFGNLLSIHDLYEQAFVYSQMAEVGFESWIGLKVWFNVWSDNSTVDFKHWLSNNQNCVKQVFSNAVDGKWKTSNCSSELPFICKISKKEPKVNPAFISNCTSGWTKFGKMCYKVFSQESWPGAREKCKGYGGDLVKVSSKAVHKEIEYLIRNTWETVWIGLNDRQEEDKFTWSDGSPLEAWKNWNHNEPNDNSSKENCVELSSTTGKWNDISCVRLLPYVCEHPLDCHDPLGMENMQIPDKNINASSYVYPYFPRNARLNMKVDGKSSAWCTNSTEANQFLQIYLGELTTIKRINTQGLYLSLRQNNYVVSYKIDYSIDGVKWMHYSENDDAGRASTRIFPGNRFSSSVEVTTLNVKAVYIRIIPVKYNGKMKCIKLELYGCKEDTLKTTTTPSITNPDEFNKIKEEKDVYLYCFIGSSILIALLFSILMKQRCVILRFRLREKTSERQEGSSIKNEFEAASKFFLPKVKESVKTNDSDEMQKSPKLFAKLNKLEDRPSPVSKDALVHVGGQSKKETSETYENPGSLNDIPTFYDNPSYEMNILQHQVNSEMNIYSNIY